MHLLYKIIYHPFINPALLWLNKGLSAFTAFQLPPSGIINIKAGTAKLKLATNQTSYVNKVLYWKGADSFEYTPVFLDLIKKCNVFFDIGANSGYYSVLAAKINPEITVHSFEPSSGPLHFLIRNREINQLQDQITINSIALSNETGEATFYEVVNSKYPYVKYNLGGVGSLQADVLKNPTIVKTETLDHFVEQNAIRNIDLIKIDTEGTEDLILRGAEQTIKSHKPIIICETLFNKIEKELEEIMRSHDYHFFNHKNGKIYEVKTIIRDRDDGVRDCFFIPSSKIHLIRFALLK